MGRRDRFVFRRVVPRAVRRAARVFAVSERTRARPRRAVRDPAGEDRPHAERRRSRVHARRRARQLPPLRRRRSRSARTRSPRPTRRRRSGCRSSSPAPRRSPRSPASSNGAARGSAATWTSRTSRISTAAPPASCSRRGTRASGCRCSRRWRAVRRSWRRTTPALREVGGDVPVYAEPDGLAAAIRLALAEAEPRSRAGLERARLFSWEETARRAVAAYREVIAP